uniref:Uncharacterized protein n=1 Tax=Timema poppense TaxID=170557 RepID=A0A7R9CY02_TIMPO|nr:unnamed protein product [Timema poppensis]
MGIGINGDLFSIMMLYSLSPAYENLCKYPYCDVAGLCTEENEVYLFTLLMHYVCVLVKHPDLLKNILKNLPPEDHVCVANVLMYLQDGEKKITSEVLRLAITKSFKDRIFGVLLKGGENGEVWVDGVEGERCLLAVQEFGLYLGVVEEPVVGSSWVRSEEFGVVYLQAWLGEMWCTIVCAGRMANNLSIYTQHKHTGPFMTANFLFGSVHDPKDKLVHLKSSSATLSRQASPLGMQFSRTSPISRITAQSPGQSVKVLSDKNREIKRLKSDLESEISENVRLQEQLKIEKDRNKELAHKLDGKTTEIKRLREDYLATEDFPSSEKGDAKVVEKRYKSEVKCLEEYVASLHVDIEKLQVEKEEVAIKWSNFLAIGPEFPGLIPGASNFFCEALGLEQDQTQPCDDK